jgi:hypothetical protein
LDEKLLNQVARLINATAFSTAADLLNEVASLLLAHFQADTAVVYELIPETGGYPCVPPLCLGNFADPERAAYLAAQASTRGMLGDFLRHWQLAFEEDAQSWADLAANYPPEVVDYSRLVVEENIRSLLFIPVVYDDRKLAAIFLHFCKPVTKKIGDTLYLEECLRLVGLRLAYLLSRNSLPVRYRRMAIAHSLYAKVATILNGQIDLLQRTIEETAVEQGLNSPIEEQLAEVRHSVFIVMRDLVINAADNVLVDLERLGFAEAISTTAAALERAWPDSQQVEIEIPLIPIVFERFPAPFRELLFALVLELMGNAIKHGGPAPYIHVDLTWKDSIVYIQVLDHGQGFEREKTKLSPYGLGFWEQFIPEQLRGHFHISSQVGFGTVVQVRIPILALR